MSTLPTNTAKFSKDTEDNWIKSDRILDDAEIAYDISNMRFKVGDGIKKWSELEYVGSKIDEELKLTKASLYPMYFIHIVTFIFLLLIVFRLVG
jgi:hypothetical protein